MISQRVKFAAIPQVQQDDPGSIHPKHQDSPSPESNGQEHNIPHKRLKLSKMWTPGVGFKLRTSKWIICCLTVLLLSNIVFMVAFVTNGWGVLLVMVDPDEEVTSPPPPKSLLAGSLEAVPPPPASENQQVDFWWGFGLWQTCRSYDGLCVGTRFPVFYSVTRALCVLGLFGHILTFALMLGHTLEKLLDNDVCTMATIISMIYATSVFMLIAVSCFGSMWAAEFRAEFQGTVAYLSYSYWLAVFSVLLNAISGTLAVVDLVTGLKRHDDGQPFAGIYDDMPYYDPSELAMMELEETLNREKHKNIKYNLKSLA